MSHFSLLNLERAFELDLKQLEAEYFKAQREFHPDRFVGKPQEEKNSALQRSMDINEAYKVLKSPLKRAKYILALEGIKVGTESDTVKPENFLLMEIMEIRENEPSRTELQALADESQKLVAEYYKNSKFAQMAQETIRLGYLSKILDEKRQIP